MKLLHTSDWHLGKTLFEHSLLEEQENFLNQITDILKDTSYDALIISGDIYDRAVPPSEAVTLFSSFLSNIKNINPKLEIILHSGNHDSPERLSFAQEILNLENIHIITDTKNITKPIIIKNCAVYTLPFLTPGSIKKNIFQNNADVNPGEEENIILRTQEELLSNAIEAIKNSHSNGEYKNREPVLSAHIFTAGSLKSESERFVQGTAEQVDSRLLDYFTYSALGHIHSMQKVGSTAWYSGSPYSYSFGESKNEKYVLSVEIEDKKAVVNPIELKPLHPLITLEDTFSNLQKEKKEYKDAYICAICTDREITLNPLQILRNIYPNILTFSYKSSKNFTNENSINKRKELLKNSENDYKKIFSEFMKDIYETSFDENNKEYLDEEKLFLEYSKSMEGK